MSAQKSLVWYELLTSDLAAAKSFYKNVVGWDMQDIPMPGMTYTVLNAGQTGVGGMMTLPQEVAAAGMKPFWSPYVLVDDVDTAAATLRSLGGQVLKSPADIPNVGRFAPVADPQGGIFNLYQPNGTASNAVSGDAGRVGWQELHATDAAKAFDFYSRQFGWTKSTAMNMGAMGVYQIFSIQGVDSGAMFNSPAAQHSAFWMIYFSVPDIDAAHARLEAGGGKVMHGPAEVPGGRFIVQAVDPQGAMFAIVGMRR